jgi:glycosyltransferase involved in cell wall biosynthesis
VPNLSVVIIAKDEERTIGGVLGAVQRLASEIVFVDSGSTDKTIEIAKGFGVKFHHQDWLGYAAQKNYALSLATGEWILSLDADEVVTPKLATEIYDVVSGGAGDNIGYRIPRLLFIGNRAIKHGGFYPDAQLRLFKRGAGKFNDRAVHEAVQIDGKVGMLENEIAHYAYTDVEQFAQAMDKYARLSVVEAQKSGYDKARLNPLNEMFHPMWTLFYRYVVRRGYLDGEMGLKLNLIYSDYVRKKITYLREAEKN